MTALAEIILISLMAGLALLVIHSETVYANEKKKCQLKAVVVCQDEDPPDFAHYKIELDLEIVEKEKNNDRKVLRELGSKTVLMIKPIQREKRLFNEGVLVRNMLTGELSPVSGNIIALLSRNANAEKIAKHIGISLYLNPSNSSLVVFKTPQSSDILDKYKKLIKLDNVQQASIEVLEHRYKFDSS